MKCVYHIQLKIKEPTNLSRARYTSVLLKSKKILIGNFLSDHISVKEAGKELHQD